MQKGDRRPEGEGEDRKREQEWRKFAEDGLRPRQKRRKIPRRLAPKHKDREGREGAEKQSVDPDLGNGKEPLAAGVCLFCLGVGINGRAASRLVGKKPARKPRADTAEKPPRRRFWRDGLAENAKKNARQSRGVT